MTHPRPQAGAAIGVFEFATTDGKTAVFGKPQDRWSMLFVYRGKHCPRCKRFLNKLNDALPAWSEKMDILVVSADTKEKAMADKKEFGWDFELGYGLTEAQMRSLGLYVSDPLSEAETDSRFAEPGAFGVTPGGELMLVDISNGPAARPDLEELLDGMTFNIDKNRPARGTA